jgi:hypothetical protein
LLTPDVAELVVLMSKGGGKTTFIASLDYTREGGRRRGDGRPGLAGAHRGRLAHNRRDVFYDEVMAVAEMVCPPAGIEAEHPLFILSTPRDRRPSRRGSCTPVAAT